VEAGELRANQNQRSACTRIPRRLKNGVDVRAHWVKRGEVPMGGYGQRERAWKRGRCGKTKTGAACAPG
jgi:hypothetical protein